MGNLYAAYMRFGLGCARMSASVPFLAQTIAIALCGWAGGAYLAGVFTGRDVLPGPMLDPLSKGLIRLAGKEARRPMDWREYAQAVLLLSGLVFVLAYLWLSAEGSHPARAFSLAARIVTGHVEAGPLAGLGWLATGISLAGFAAVTRGLTQNVAQNVAQDRIGNAWTDLTSAILYVLIPLLLLRIGWMASAGVVEALDNWRSGAPDLGAMAAQLSAAAMAPRSGATGPLIASALFQMAARMAGKPRLGVVLTMAGTMAAPWLDLRMPLAVAENLSWLAALIWLIAHFWLMIPALAVAGSRLRLMPVPAGSGR